MTDKRALRVVFSHSGNDVRMEAAKELDLVVPPSLDTGESRRAGAFYFELQDEGGRVIYRRAGDHPAPRFIEVPSGQREHPFAHVDAGDLGSSAEGVFSILLPRVAGGRYVELFATETGEAYQARSIGRFDLDDAPDSWVPPEVEG
jgi:hypothetical protein